MNAPSDGCKVDRMAEKYGLVDLSATLERRHDDDDESLRSLATYVNARILERALDRAGADPLADPADIYERLSDDEVDAGTRVELETNLRQAGVDVETLTADFVSHVTVRTHLNDCLDRDTGRTRDITADGATSTIDWARSRMMRVVETTIERLVDAELVAITDFSVVVTLDVTCRECGGTYSPRELLESGGCECHSGPDGDPVD